MKILNAKVYHNEQYANPPTLQVLVDHNPTWEEIQALQHKSKDVYNDISMSEDQQKIVDFGSNSRFEPNLKKAGTAYFAEKDGYAHFLFHNPNYQLGYAERVFNILLEDGSTVALKGPWSSNPQAMRRIFGIPTMDVSLTDDPKVFERGYTYHAAHITLDLAKTALPFISPHYVIDEAILQLRKVN